jgi:hypothetical protein
MFSNHSHQFVLRSFVHWAILTFTSTAQAANVAPFVVPLEGQWCATRRYFLSAFAVDSVIGTDHTAPGRPSKSMSATLASLCIAYRACRTTSSRFLRRSHRVKGAQTLLDSTKASLQHGRMQATLRLHGVTTFYIPLQILAMSPDNGAWIT